jgi:hypothetical protein
LHFSNTQKLSGISKDMKSSQEFITQQSSATHIRPPNKENYDPLSFKALGTTNYNTNGSGIGTVQTK